MAREIEGKLTHLDEKGQERMVDVSGKSPTHREAVAEGILRLPEPVSEAIRTGALPKGDFYATARIAGILAAKQTSTLIPLSHPLPLEHVQVEVWFDQKQKICARAKVVTDAKTGVEMEALTAVTVALLTVYDMLKALGKGMELGPIRLQSKTGGKSGEYAVPSLFEEDNSSS
ncbi:MAG: cyclic pyranopterin monophosphate synthase MoaC [Candidatus Hydrogenedentota bacterium]|jgi:cyclic pyranopterin phosphate synthase|nr:MAG: cyclic pyranopterin monophosphate synthase MoaC [Candidatus Hydrogenedentota bacterium]